MTDRDALLAGVLAAPADDLPRLVVADYLEDHGTTDADRARAEFIRAQIAAYRDPRPVAETNGRAALRAKELLRQYRGDWLPRVPADYRDAVSFARGFPDTLAVRDAGTAQAFVGRALPPDVATADGLVLGRGISDPPLSVTHLAAPGIARVRRLRFGLFRHAWQVLAAPVWGGLEELDLTTLPPGVPPRALAFPRVRRLCVSIWDNTEWVHLTGEAFPAVEDLAVSELEVGAAAFDHVRGSDLFRGLRRLLWGPVPLTESDVLALADGSAAPALDELAVFWPWDVVPVAEFVAALDRPGLRHLTLVYAPAYPGASSPGVTSTGGRVAAALAANRRLAGLRTLALPDFPVDAAAVVGLLESPHLPNLRRVSVTLRGESYPLRRHLMDAPPERLEKLFVGNVGFPRAVSDRLGPRLEGTPDTPEALARLRRTRPDF